MNNDTSPQHTDGLQLRLIALADVDPYRFEDPLQGWSLTDVRALALDPEVTVRRVAALSVWNWDIRLQEVLASDPDETVVMNLLSRVDPSISSTRLILDGPHPEARRALARRNLVSEILFGLIHDTDQEVQWSARKTLVRRCLLAPESNAAST